jgi:hypothetical protein
MHHATHNRKTARNKKPMPHLSLSLIPRQKLTPTKAFGLKTPPIIIRPLTLSIQPIAYTSGKPLDINPSTHQTSLLNRRSLRHRRIPHIPRILPRYIRVLPQIPHVRQA